MTRRTVYGVGLLLTLACTVMTIASITMPRWLSYSPNDQRKFSYGLHKHCSAVKGTCDQFPKFKDCVGDKWSFCSMWRSVGFLMDFAVIIELCTVVSFAVVIAGGVQRRTKGWTIVCSLLLLSGIFQCVAMALVAFLFNNDERFSEGWYLDESWLLCTISWAALVFTSAGIFASWIYLPEEGGYELIPNVHNHGMEVEEDHD